MKDGPVVISVPDFQFQTSINWLPKAKQMNDMDLDFMNNSHYEVCLVHHLWWRIMKPLTLVVTKKKNNVLMKWYVHHSALLSLLFFSDVHSDVCSPSSLIFLWLFALISLLCYSTKFSFFPSWRSWNSQGNHPTPDSKLSFCTIFVLPPFLNLLIGIEAVWGNTLKSYYT